MKPKSNPRGLLSLQQILTVPDGDHADGNRLLLRVRGNGTRASWVYRFTSPVSGTRKELGRVKRYPFDGRHDPARSVVRGRPAWSCHSNTTTAGGGQRAVLHCAAAPRRSFSARQRRSNSLGVR